MIKFHISTLQAEWKYMQIVCVQNTEYVQRQCKIIVS